MRLSGGTRLGPYDILFALGAGGMGEVYRARDTRLDRDVALKVLPGHLVDDRDALERFAREAKAVAALSHPNILAIHDYGTADGTTYAVMELLEGETLRQRLDRGPLPRHTAIDYASQIARGLAAAHDRGIVHRDVKPENILLTRDGRVKILDFGLAKARPDAHAGETGAAPTIGVTDPGVVLGTMGYMSPEQVRAQPVDHRSDVFAFGCVLYEMLSGTRAFHRESASDTLAAILRDAPQAPPANARLPPALDRIVRRCLEKEREARFHSAHDIAFDLEAAARDIAAARSASTGRARQAWRLAALAGTGLAAGALAWHLYSTGLGTGSAPVRSLAVLPLANLSGDPEQQYFADGMTDALITNLAQLGGLKVISRTSIMQYRDSRKQLPEIARELGVQAIVEGSVQRQSERVRISAQLIHAPDDTHLWAQSYEAEVRDILALQKRVARAIAEEIRLQLAPEQTQRLASARQVNPEAHEAYLKGLHHVLRVNLEDFGKARSHFERAIALDPGYAPPYAQLGFLFDTLAVFGGMRPRDAAPLARAATEKALELDDTLADAHMARACVLRDLDWDFAGSERAFQRALELNPGHALARDMYGVLLLALGRLPEAEAQLTRAKELDPLSLDVNNNFGFILYAQRDFARAVRAYRSTIELDPSFVMAHRELGMVLSQAGRPEEAVAEAEKATALSRDPYTLSVLGHLQARAGQHAEARKILAELERAVSTGDASPFHLAYVRLGLGELDAALDGLEAAYEERQPQLTWMGVDPSFDPLRRHPRFQNLLRRIGLPGREL